MKQMSTTVMTRPMISCYLSDAHCGSHLELVRITPEALKAAGVVFGDEKDDSYETLMAAREQTCFAVPKRFLSVDQKIDSPYVGAAWHVLTAEEAAALPTRSTRLLELWTENKRRLDVRDAEQHAVHSTSRIVVMKKTKKKTKSVDPLVASSITLTHTHDAGSATTLDELPDEPSLMIAKVDTSAAVTSAAEHTVDFKTSVIDFKTSVVDFKTSVDPVHDEYGDEHTRAVHSLAPVWKIVLGATPNVWKLANQREQLYKTDDDDATLGYHDSFVTLDVANRIFPSWKLGCFVSLHHLVNEP
jgi:hypothetical protein